MRALPSFIKFSLLAASIGLLSACGGGDSSGGESVFGVGGATPSPQPEPTVEPSPQETDDPIAVPTVEPTANPTPTPNVQPTPTPPVTPSPVPSVAPTFLPELPEAISGIFIDGPVVNIDYRTQTITDQTSAIGEFAYRENEQITFFIGGIEFPTVNAASLITPFDLAGTNSLSDPLLINIIRLLQSFDDDGELDDAITILDASKQNQATINFNQSVVDFGNDPIVLDVVANFGTGITELVSVEDALIHFANELVQRGDLDGTDTDGDGHIDAIDGDPNNRLIGIDEDLNGAGDPFDVVPEDLIFTALLDLDIQQQVTSDTVTIADIEIPIGITVDGGEYSLNGAAFTANAGMVDVGDTIQLRANASTAFSTTSTITVTIHETPFQWQITTEPEDLSPAPFSFTDVTNVQRTSANTASLVTVSEINSNAPISITNGAQYAINDGPFTGDAGFVQNDDTVLVQLVASPLFDTTVTTTLTIGDQSADFSVTTELDNEPDLINFTAVTEAPLSQVVSSNTVTVSGIQVPVAVSVDSGTGLFSIEGGTFTSDATTVSNGQTLQAQVTASANTAEETAVTLNLAGQLTTFSVTTVTDNTPPTASIAFPPPTSTTDGDYVYIRGTAQDDQSEITSLFVDVDGVPHAATDTSAVDEPAFSSWEVTSGLNGEGVDLPNDQANHSLVVRVTDAVGNEQTNAATVVVNRDSTRAFFPPENVVVTEFSRPFYDEVNNRLISADFSSSIKAVDLNTGLVTNFSDDTVGPSAEPYREPESILQIGGDFLIGDTSLLAGDEIARLFQLSGDGTSRTLVFDLSTPNFADTISFGGMILNPRNSDELLMIGSGGIGRVNLVNQTFDIFSAIDQQLIDRDLTPGAVPAGSDPNLIVGGFLNSFGFDPQSDLLYANNFSQILTINPDSGDRQLFFDASTDFDTFAPLGERLSENGFFLSITIDSQNRRALVVHSCQGLNGTGCLFSINLDTKELVELSSNVTPNSLNNFIDPELVELAPNLGYFIVTALDIIYAVDKQTGNRTIISRAGVE